MWAPSLSRGTSLRDDQRLKAALDQLQSTTVMMSIRQLTARRRRRFSSINEWKEPTAPTVYRRCRLTSLSSRAISTARNGLYFAPIPIDSFAERLHRLTCLTGDNL